MIDEHAWQLNASSDKVVRLRYHSHDSNTKSTTATAVAGEVQGVSNEIVSPIMYQLWQNSKQDVFDRQ
jgi:hypothetical protein